jgi:hypothetical protein
MLNLAPTVPVAPDRPASLRQAVSRLGGACIYMLSALNETDPTQRRRARAKLFDAAMWVAWLVLMEDEEEELCLPR